MNNTTDNKNMIYFLVISMAVLAIYQFFVFGPQQKKREAAMQVAAAASSSAAAKGLPLGGVSTTLTREQALATSPRITISTPSLKGSIALKGALIDDLYMIKYDQTVEKKNDPVELLTPAGAKNAYYVQSAYFAQNVPGMPDNNTVWTQTGGSVLSPGQPVVLSYVNGTGLTFTRTLSIDANYMITEDDAVTNTGTAPVSFQPFSVVMRSGMPADAGKNAVVHEGAIATYSKTMDKPKLGDYRTASLKYKDIVKPNTVNPDYQRYELHRVWIVQATVKSGVRHIYKRKILYVDEDTWLSLWSEAYDSHDQLWRTSFIDYHYSAECECTHRGVSVYHDLTARAYEATYLVNEAGPGNWWKLNDPANIPDLYSPKALANAGH